MKYQTIPLKWLFALKGMIYYVAIEMVISLTCEDIMFSWKAHLVFHWCLYNKKINVLQ